MTYFVTRNLYFLTSFYPTPPTFHPLTCRNHQSPLELMLFLIFWTIFQSLMCSSFITLEVENIILFKLYLYFFYPYIITFEVSQIQS